MTEREYLLWLVTGWRWCVALPVVFAVGIAIGFALGKI
jgi:hypothetical protein